MEYIKLLGEAAELADKQKSYYKAAQESSPDPI